MALVQWSHRLSVTLKLAPVATEVWRSVIRGQQRRASTCRSSRPVSDIRQTKLTTHEGLRVGDNPSQRLALRATIEGHWTKVPKSLATDE